MRTRRRPRHASALASGSAGDGLGSSADALLGSMQAAVSQHPALYTLEFLLLGAAAYAAAVWPDRPRGWCFNELLAVRPGPAVPAGCAAAAALALC